MTKTNILFAGGTGFVGRSFLAALPDLNIEPPLKILIPTRNAAKFRAENAGLFTLQAYEVEVIEKPISELRTQVEIDTLIHGAETPKPTYEEKDLQQSLALTDEVLELAHRTDAKNIIYLSSGAIYDLIQAPPPFLVENLDTHQPPSNLIFKNNYSTSKFINEKKVIEYCKKYNRDYAIFRIFNLISPYVPLSGRYAIGNFIRDLLSATSYSIDIRGSGQDQRSFITGKNITELIYSSISRRLKNGIYNACSLERTTIRQLAELVKAESGTEKRIEVLNPKSPARHYTGIPNIPPSIRLHDQNLAIEIQALIRAKEAGYSND